jgi:hypothetical protein
MQARRAARPALCAFLLFGCVSFAPLTEHAHAAQALKELPPLLYTCPMHPDHLQDDKGTCPICKMALEPVRIATELNYACPVHRVRIVAQPGTCPFDGRPLVPVVVTLHWTCKQSPDQKLMEPGNCADGTARTLVKEVRAHGDHNPRYGGQFFMASDQWHHLEGTYPRAGFFRAYFYDNFTQPIDVKGFTGVVVREQLDGATNTLKQVESFPLKPGRNNTLEAALKSDKLPNLNLTLKVKFNKDSPEQLFNFKFNEYSVVPASAPATTTSAGASAGQAAPVAQPAPEPQPVAVAQAIEPITNCEPNMTRSDALLLSDALPKTTPALLNLLDMCGAEVQKLIEGRQFGFIYQPTMLGKDIALALEGHVTELPEPRRVQAADGIRRTVLSAWQLDMYGDLGNQDKLTEAYNLFAAAVAAIKSAYGAKP